MIGSSSSLRKACISLIAIVLQWGATQKRHFNYGLNVYLTIYDKNIEGMNYKMAVDLSIANPIQTVLD